MKLRIYTGAFAACLLLSACSGVEKDTSSYPITKEEQRKKDAGSILSGGEGGGFTLFGGGDRKKASAGDASVAVNNFLWRATLDTVSFMPLASTDPFGGVIITDWHENPEKPGERFKLHALILTKELRADGLRISLFRQVRDPKGNWKDAVVGEDMNREMENIILSRARELRVRSSN
jgi:hypothetical protein